MHDVLLEIGIGVFIIYAVVSMAYMMNVWRTNVVIREFLKNTEGSLNESLLELRGTLQNLRKITSDIGAVTDDVRQIADTMANVEKDVRYLYHYIKNEFGAAAESQIAGLKAGVKTGVATLVRTLKERKGDDHEGRTEGRTE